MADPTLYQRLKRVALPHLAHSRTDLTVHDRAICRALQPGDAAIYAVRESGTHFACFRNTADTGPAKAEKTAQFAIDYLDAILATSHDVRWYLVECTSPQRGTASPISFAAARLMVMQTRDRMRVALARSDGRAA